jgi:multidrug resistance efflux pump
MTQDWPAQTGYDPTWRSFKGKTAFAPHPSSLETANELAWPHVYTPAPAPQPDVPPPEPETAPAAELLPGPMPAPAAPPEPPPLEAKRDVAPDDAAAEPELHPFVPDSVPSIRSPHPTFEPVSPLDAETPRLDFKAFRVPMPIPTTPVGKLASVYPKPETPVPPRPKRRSRPWATRPVGMACIVGAVVLAGLLFIVIPKMLASQTTLKTMFTAPMLVLRAVGPGEITNVAVTIGQPVEPSTVLLTIHANPLSDAAVDDLKTRLTQARARQTGLEGAAATPATSRQKEAAAAEVDALQKALAAAGGSGGADQPILAGVRGIVWSLDAQAGGKLQAGDPLAQLADCGRAFLVLQGAPSTLKAGQTVLIRMPGVRPFHGTVRPSAGVAEPPNTLVIDPTGFSAASPNACPVGATAEIKPETPS